MKLKPCPFCGGRASLECGEGGEYYVVCVNHECGGAPFYGSGQEVLDLWNRRPERNPATSAQQRKGAICRTCHGSGVIGHMNPGDGMSDTSSECSKCGGTGRRAPVAS
jgi:hypothetical protein